MKSSTKILSILAASSLVASIPVVLAQGAPPPPPAPPPAAPMAAPTGNARGGPGGPGGPGAFQAPDAPTADELATLNKALKDLITKADPDTAKIFAAHPTWNPLQPARGGAPGANFGGNTARGGRNMGGGTAGRRGGAGAPGGSGA